MKPNMNLVLHKQQKQWLRAALKQYRTASQAVILLKRGAGCPPGRQSGTAGWVSPCAQQQGSYCSHHTATVHRSARRLAPPARRALCPSCRSHRVASAAPQRSPPRSFHVAPAARALQQPGHIVRSVTSVCSLHRFCKLFGTTSCIQIC